MKKGAAIRLTFYFLLVLLSLPVSGLFENFVAGRLCITTAMVIPVIAERIISRAPILGARPFRGGWLALATFPFWLCVMSLAAAATSLLMQALGLPITSPTFSFSFSSFLFVVILTPVTEELFCRYVLRTLCRRLSGGEGGVILATALLFSLMHANAIQLPYALLGGLLLGAAATISDSVLLPILLHIGVNLFSLLTVKYPTLGALPILAFPTAAIPAILVFTDYGQRACAPLRAAVFDREGRRRLFSSLLRSPAPLCLVGSLLLAVLRML